jgi:dipeptidyl aminopeptidase/acylaminoacyl peptidase
MSKKILVLVLVFSYLTVTVFTAAAQAAASKPIGSDFFTHVKRISHLQVWNNQVFFTLSQADKEKNRYSSDLYQLVDNQPLRIAKNVSDYFFQDGGIIFRENRNAPTPTDTASTTFLKLSSGFGEADEWVKLPFRAAQIEWINRDTFFYTTSYHRNPDRNKNYHIYDELPFRSNGRGDISGQRTHLYFYNQGQSHLLSDTLSSATGIQLSPNTKTLLYTLKPAWSGKQPEGNRLISLDVATLQTKEWNLFPRATYSHLTFINNDEIILTIHRNLEHDRIENPGIYRLHLRTGHLTLVYDGARYTIGNSISTDIGSGARSEITFDDQGLRFITTDVDYAPLVHLAWKDATIRPLSPGRLTLQEYQPYRDGFLAIALDEQRGAEIYYIDKKGKALPLTAINQPVFDEYTIVKPVEITFTGQAGEVLTGYVLPPAHYEPGRKYPAILDIHGGPQTAYGTIFFHEMQYWANEGYAVFFTNPPGSSGRGTPFADIRGQVGKIDYHDLMTFTDTVLAQTNYIDPTRLGVTGGSYGGLMTNWIIGHTPRFKAAVSQRGISSWLSFSNTSDIGHTFTHTYFGTDAWKNASTLWDASPLQYADQVQTPTLFIHSQQDYRCPLVESLQMYYALQYFNIPSRLVLFENENHELSRSGHPQNRIKRLEEIKNWFDKFLKD